MLFCFIKGATPTQCNKSERHRFNATSSYTIQRNQTCARDFDSLGTTHCASAAIKYRTTRGEDEEGIFEGCIDCQGK